MNAVYLDEPRAIDKQLWLHDLAMKTIVRTFSHGGRGYSYTCVVFNTAYEAMLAKEG